MTKEIFGKLRKALKTVKFSPNHDMIIITHF